MDPLTKKLQQLRKKQEINAKYVQASIDAAKRIEENRPVPSAPERSIEEELLDSQFQNSQALDNLKTFMREVDAVKGLNILQELDDVIDFNSYFPYFQEDTLKKQKNISPPIFRALWLRFKRKLEEEELKAPAVGQEIRRKRIEQPSEQAALEELAGIEGVSEPEIKSMQRELLKAARRRKRGIEEEKIIGEEEEIEPKKRSLDEETINELRDIVNKGLLTEDSGITLQNTTYKYGDLLKLYADDKLLFKGQKRTSDEQIKLPDALFDKIRGTVDSFRRVSNKGVSDDLIIKSRQIMYDLNTAYDNLDKTKQDITELKQRYIGKHDNIQYIQRLNELKDKEKQINAEITDLKKGTDTLEKDIRDAINETAKEDIAEKQQTYRENKERTEAALAEAKEKLIRGKEFKLREEAEISNLRILMEDAFDKIKAWNDYMKLPNKGKKEAKRRGKVPERPTDETYRLYNQLIGINMDPNISYEDVMEQLKERNVDIENLPLGPRREFIELEFSGMPPRRESIQWGFSETPPRRESATEEFIQFAPEEEKKEEMEITPIKLETTMRSPKSPIEMPKIYVPKPVISKYLGYVNGPDNQGAFFDRFVENYGLTNEQIVEKIGQYKNVLGTTVAKIKKASSITQENRDKIINALSRADLQLAPMKAGKPEEFPLSKTAKSKLLTIKGGKLPAKRNISYQKLYTKYGSGLKISQRFSKPLYAPFGQYALHLPSLTKNAISVKYMSGSHCLPFPKTVISDDLKNMLLDIIEDSKFDESEYMKLSEPEKKLFDDLSSFAKVDLDTSLRMYRHKKYNDADNRKKLERFELLRSQLIAGNDNKNIIRELKPLMLYLQDQKMISRADFNKIMYYILYSV